MSITVSAKPYALISNLITIFSAVQKDEKQSADDFYLINQRMKEIMNSVNQAENEITPKVQEQVAEEICNVICREYDTIFVDKELLLKTLEEHGFDNFDITDDAINCELDIFKINFYKNNSSSENIATTPYSMKISADCKENDILELINDINAEYTSNTQEENYIKIKKRLENQGLKIDEEEVFEDDTIILTVNIG